MTACLLPVGYTSECYADPGIPAGLSGKLSSVIAAKSDIAPADPSTIVSDHSKSKECNANPG